MSKKNRRTSRIDSSLKLKPNLRLSLFRSNNHIYAQLIDDEKSTTILSASSAEKKIKEIKSTPKEIAFKVGEKLWETEFQKRILNKK